MVMKEKTVCTFASDSTSNSTLYNKVDELQLMITRKRDILLTSTLSFTWLNNMILDSMLHLLGFQIYRADCDMELSWELKEDGIY